MTSPYYQNLNRRVMSGAFMMFPPAFPRTRYDNHSRHSRPNPASGIVPLMLTPKGKRDYLITRWGQVVRRSKVELWALSKMLRDRLSEARSIEQARRNSRKMRRQRRREVLARKRRRGRQEA